MKPTTPGRTDAVPRGDADRACNAGFEQTMGGPFAPPSVQPAPPAREQGRVTKYRRRETRDVCGDRTVHQRPRPGGACERVMAIATGQSRFRLAEKRVRGVKYITQCREIASAPVTGVNRSGHCGFAARRTVHRHVSLPGKTPDPTAYHLFPRVAPIRGWRSHRNSRESARGSPPRRRR